MSGADRVDGGTLPADAFDADTFDAGDRARSAGRAVRGVVVVTGGGSGIGAATGRVLTERGWTVALVDRAWPTENEHGTLPGEGTPDDHGATRWTADVTDDLAVRSLVTRIRARLGAIRGAVTCAGVIETADTLDTTAESFRRVLDVNVTGTFLVARECARAMAGSGGGSIVTVSSVSGLLAAPQRASYGASKGAIIALTRVFALDLADRGVRVNCVAPGATQTPLMRSAQPEALSAGIRAATPQHRAADPREIAEVVDFLLDDRSGFVTGQTWAVDGGQSIQAGWQLPAEQARVPA